MTFKDLGLSEGILKAVEVMGYENPTPIQELAIPVILKKQDILGCAQTGTGKTAAFVLPIIENLLSKGPITHEPRVLVLSPTRELAIQTRDNVRSYGTHTNLKCAVILGGVNQRSQVEVLRKGVDIIVATPGRLLDLVNQRIINLSNIEVLVLDEADTMLDMGFIYDIKKVVARVPKIRQTLMFSATMPKAIKALAAEFLNNPVIIETNNSSITVEKIDQTVYFVDTPNKKFLLLEILKTNTNASTLIFTRTKHGANKLGEILQKNSFYNEVIHGNKSQSARVRALKNFKDGKSNILIATDIAARGIDIKYLTQVINFELPNLAESYVHRIGRTGRAGSVGKAISLCDKTEKRYLYDIERLLKQSITVIKEHNYINAQVINNKNYSQKKN